MPLNTKSIPSKRSAAVVKKLPANAVVRPFLKWAGAKTRIIHRISEFVPVDATRLIEPFAGSCAVALNLGFKENLLADANKDLVNLYECLGTHNGRFIEDCAKLFVSRNNTEAAYYRLRDEFNTTKTKYRKATLFVYLNRHCFNGLCRYNASGKFNVPIGKYAKPHFPEQEMRKFYTLMQRSTIIHADFRSVIAKAGTGDFVYCDPPYVPASSTANFTAYSKGGFSTEDQQALVDVAIAATTRGAVVAISNHDTPVTKALYKEATTLRYFDVPRRISCDGENRVDAKEVMAVFNPRKLALRGRGFTQLEFNI